MSKFLFLFFLSASAWAAPGEDIVGTDAPEAISGTENNDTVDGRQGDDLILMGDGLDIAFWQPGDGDDIINCGEGFDGFIVGDNTFRTNRLGEPVFEVDNSIASCRIDPTGRRGIFRAQILAKPDLTPAARILLVNCEFVICADPDDVGKQVIGLPFGPRPLDRVPFYARNNLTNPEM